MVVFDCLSLWSDFEGIIPYWGGVQLALIPKCIYALLCFPMIGIINKLSSLRRTKFENYVCIEIVKLSVNPLDSDSALFENY